MTIVIVGGGHAGGQAAASLRQEGYDGEVILLADEPHIPYQRPPLSKQYLAGEHGLERVYLRPAAFYDSKGIAVRTGVRATGIDADAKRVECESGERVGYDKLLLATGSRVRKLAGVDHGIVGAHYLRTIADVDAIRAELKPEQRVAVVGGGYIGLEVAAVAVEMGACVTVLEMEERILGRVTTPEMSAFYHGLHTGKGVQIRTGWRVRTLVAENGRLASVESADGERLEADLAVIGIGIVPNVELAAAAGLDCNDGIVVDERARTSNPDIYAAGDCTNHPNPVLGRRLRLESVPNAMEQSRVAAANLAGNDRTYASVPWFWSDQYDLKLQMVGFSADADRHVTRGDPDKQEFATFHLAGDTVLAADAVNSAREFMAARQLVGKQVDADSLADPLVDLRTLVTGR